MILIGNQNFTATSVDGDYDFFSMIFTFTPGSADRAEKCGFITILSDNMVEGRESFTVKLSLLTAGENLFTRNNVTAVILIDSDGKQSYMLKATCSFG